ncbi:hypothetical protein AD951_02685 [Acetobacter malorum]|uniref:Uncharacterized protein n=1 Tax=Acetobacter malorum TaxID=178901 RepID=A0A149URI1_9PROT|nr:hypothetical protein [Acetobacter malorum]KXV70532.1 hypothetical protein AD951_02685 [Acetobacter malorum]
MDLADHPFHTHNIARESGASDMSTMRWLKFCNDVETALGHDLDGADIDGCGCGYSLDEAHDQWSSGMTPAGYVALVRSRARYRAPIG